MQSVGISHAWDEFFSIFDFAVTTPACRQGRDFAVILANSFDSSKRNFKTSSSDVINLAAMMSFIQKCDSRSSFKTICIL